MSSEKPLDSNELSKGMEQQPEDTKETEQSGAPTEEAESKDREFEQEVIVLESPRKSSTVKTLNQKELSGSLLEEPEKKSDETDPELVFVSKEEQAPTKPAVRQHLSTGSDCASDAHDGDVGDVREEPAQNISPKKDEKGDEKYPDEKVDDQDKKPDDNDEEKELLSSESEESESITETVDTLSKADVEQVLNACLEVTDEVKLEDSPILSRYEQPANQGQNRHHDNLPEPLKKVQEHLTKLQRSHNSSDLLGALEEIKDALTSLLENPVATSEEDVKEDNISTIDCSTEEWKTKVLKVDDTEQIMTAAGFTQSDGAFYWEMKKDNYDKEKVENIRRLLSETIKKCSSDWINTYSSRGVKLKVLQETQQQWQQWQQNENKENEAEENEPKSSLSPGERFAQNIIVPETKVANRSFAEVLKNSGKHAENIGKANVYVCHTRQGEFESLVEAIENYENLKSDGLNRYYLLDYFAINQTHDQQAAQSIIDNLKDILDDVKEFVLVVTSWGTQNSPIALTRAWCLLEMASARRAGVDFFVSMPKEQHELFRKSLISSDILACAKVFQNVNIDQAKTSVKEDYTAIDKKVDADFGSNEEFNALLSNFLRFWFEGTLENLYNDWPEEPETPVQLKYLEQLARYFFKYGSPKAIGYHKKYIELSTKLYGPKNLNTLMMNVRLAMALINMGKYSEVLAPLRTAIKGAKETLVDPPEKAHTKYMLFWADIIVTVLSKTELTKAMQLEREVSRARQKLGQKKDRQLKQLHKLCKKAKSEQFDKALKPLEELLEQIISLKGETAPITMRTRKNLAHLYTALNKHEEAFSVQDDFLKFATDRYGKGSQHVLVMKNMQAKTLFNLERRDEATEMYEHVIKLGTKRFGKDSLVVNNAEKGLIAMAEKDKEDEKQDEKEDEKEEKQ